ncbi:MAG: response regulator [Chloroflexia bacterium]
MPVPALTPLETIKGSVLIVDDDGFLLDTLTQALTEEEYFVVGARDGVQAISMLDLVEYNLILLDLHLPRVHGTEVAKLFKELAVSAPIVIMTGHLMGRQFAKDLGLAGCLEKPFGLEELFAVVTTHCNPVPLPFDGNLWQTF